MEFSYFLLRSFLCNDIFQYFEINSDMQKQNNKLMYIAKSLGNACAPTS